MYIRWQLESYTDKWTASGKTVPYRKDVKVKVWRIRATANILDMSYKEIRIKFKETAIVGVGNGMFYCDATEVVDTTMKDSPMMLWFLVTGSNFRILA